ncbi:MAG TPA: ArsA family ATPase [Thermoanaerobaculia bacterium]|nr:ArsA family ATPase [Thermoanaerobaculia bacterium]
MKDEAPQPNSSLVLHPSSFPDALRSLSSRQVLLFSGKGGVGKTTLSAAAALHFAKTGRTILFSTDPASNLGDLFEEQPANVRIESLDANALYARFLEKNLGSFLEIGDRGTYLDRDELRRFFELSLPGVDEIMAWMRIGELAEEDAGAMLVVDTAPTGHTIRLLGAAEHFRQFALALDAMAAKHRELVRQFTRRNVRDAVDEFIERFDQEARRRRELLTDARRTAFLPVMLSEPWVVEQTRRLIAEVREVGIDVPFAILNRAVVDPDCDRDRERQKADAAADAGVPTVVAPRSCVPLDSRKALEGWLSGAPPSGAPPSGAPPTRRPPAQKVAARNRGALLKPSRLTFLAGKGGVGKTTIATSIALQLAQANPSGQYTIISVDPAHALRDVFATEKPPANLAVEIVDTRAKWRRFRETLGNEIDRAVAALAPSGVHVAYETESLRKLIEVAPPGADELFAINRLSELAADETRAAVIIDTAPTGHFLRLIELPETAAEWVREFMRILLRYREVIRPGSLGEELVEASRALKLLDETLHSARAAVIVVTRPERVVVAETKRLLATLEQRGIAVGAVVANYVTPPSECRCDQSMMAAEMDSLSRLGSDVILVARHDGPVTRLADLAGLVTVTAD